MLMHLRLEAGQEQSVSPTKAGAPTGPESGDVLPPVDLATDMLSHVIHDINDRHGSTLGSTTASSSSRS